MYKMFNHRHYVPILKGKDGEFRALACLPASSGPNFTPFIDVPRRDVDSSTKQPREAIDIYLAKKAKKLQRYWGTTRILFVDVFDLDLGLRTYDGMTCVESLFNQLRILNIKSIPVIGLDRSGDSDYVKAIRTIARADRRGVCMRLLKDDMEIPLDTFSYVDELIGDLGLTKNNIHMLMDFRSLPTDDIDDTTEIATNFLANLPNTPGWQSITLSASGFPENLGDVKKNSINTLPRTELSLRDRLFSNKRNIPRFPAFGDYGICHPDILDFDPKYTPSAAIRYTTDREWLIVKAENLKKHGFGQFRGLSIRLRQMPEYYGPNYSWGDRYIKECGERSAKHGNLTTWRQVGTNHHITLVCSQIANSP